jgi:hypothetical protein
MVPRPRRTAQVPAPSSAHWLHRGGNGRSSCVCFRGPGQHETERDRAGRGPFVKSRYPRHGGCAGRQGFLQLRCEWRVPCGRLAASNRTTVCARRSDSPSQQSQARHSFIKPRSLHLDLSTPAHREPLRPWSSMSSHSHHISLYSDSSSWLFA